MENQQSLTVKSDEIACSPRADYSISLIPKSKEFEQNFICYRINLRSLEITEKSRDSIEQALSSGKKFLRLGGVTLMLNSISSIEPMSRIENIDWVQRIADRRKQNER